MRTTYFDGINAMSTVSRRVIQIIIYSLHHEFHRELTCLSMTSISDLVPSKIFPRDSIRILSNINLANPEFHLPQSVDLLNGAGATLSMMLDGQINLSRKNHDLYLQNTRLDWVIAGGSVFKKYRMLIH